MSASLDNKAQNETMDPWTHRQGILAWAPRPAVASDSQRTMHPSILFPSWALAMTSEIITESNQINEDDKKSNEIKLIGCKRPIAIRDLSRNRVPARLALGTGKNGSKYRPKIVAYFLGVEDGEPAWGSVKVESVRQYTLKSCENLCREMSWSNVARGTVKVSSKEQILFLAMQEASIVVDRPQFDPKNICQSLVTQSSGYNKDADESKAGLEQRMTPENFDDWTTGGNTQADTQSQTQNFSQVVSSSVLTR